MAQYWDGLLNSVKSNAQTFLELFFDRRAVLPHYLCDKSSVRLVEPLRSFKRLYEELWCKGQDGLNILRSTYSISEDPGEKLGLATAKTIVYDVYDLNKVHFAKDFIHPSRFFIRKEYLEIHKHIEKHAKGNYVVTGNPGIGKSWFLMYALIQRLVAGKTTIYAPNAEYWFLFDPTGVYAFDATHMDQLDKLIKDWYPHDQGPELGSLSGDILFDCNALQPMPPFNSKGWRKKWHCVITASPRHANLGQFVKDWPYAELCGMMPWSWYEIVALNALPLPALSKPIDHLWELFSKYGATPRITFNSSAAVDEKRLKDAVSACVASEVLSSPLNIDVSPVTRTLLAVEPRVRANKINRHTLVLRIATPYIADYLVRASMRRAELADSFRMAIPTMLAQGRNDIVAAMLFKAAARYCLQNDDSTQILRPLTSKKAYKLVLGIETVQTFTSINDLKTQREGVYFVPSQPMFPAIDALAFVMKTPILIRYATSLECPIDSAGLELLEEVLPVARWSYVFVVPESIADSFHEQPLTRPLKKKLIQIDQYVMGLSMDDLFPQAQKAIDMSLQQATTSIISESPAKRRLHRSDTSEVPVAKRLRSNEHQHEPTATKTVARPKPGQKVTVEIPAPPRKRATRKTRKTRL